MSIVGTMAKIPLKGTRALIFNHLLENDASAIELKKKLRINESAVRRHLDILEREGLITHYFYRASVGRPKKLYRVTPVSKELLPNRSDVLLAILGRKVADTYGKKALKSLMNLVSEDLAQYFLPPTPMESQENAERHLEEMVRLFDEFGFVASLKKCNGEFIVTYRHCVFGGAIRAFNEQLCEMHRMTVARITGGKVQLEKSIAKGDEICSQRVILVGVKRE